MALTGINSPAINDPRMTLEQRIRLEQIKGPGSPEETKLLNAAQEFESFFTYMLLKEMRKTVMETPLFHGGRAEEIFRDMLDEEVGKEMARTPGQGLGIADILYQQLSRPMIAKRLQAQSDSAGTDYGME